MITGLSDSGDNTPVFHPSDGSALQEHGRALCTFWATLSTRPLT
ncbi:hypothetical protein [Streptomyces sp. AC512_CC834]|nr:hypothetical protein [Streptomyces sp. AC512_CC834]